MLDEPERDMEAMGSSAGVCRGGEGPSNGKLTQEYLSYIDDLDGDEQGRRDAWKAMGLSSAIWQGHPAYLSYVPRIFDEWTRRRFDGISKTVYGILKKVVVRYLSDASYRRLFRFDPRVEELILLPVGYEQLLPYLRIDVFYDEEADTFSFCEFNADASSGMNEMLEIDCALSATRPYRRFVQEHQTYTDANRLFCGWTDDFLAVYRSCKDAKSRPTIAIVGLWESAGQPFGEFVKYAQLFERHGSTCLIADARDLIYKDGRLMAGKTKYGPVGTEIDAVWRFCITVDIMRYWDESQALIEAVRAESVALIGGFVTQLVHDKQLFAILHKSDTMALLSKEERAFVRASIPRTMFLGDPTTPLEEIRENPSLWIIKPTDWYSSINVYSGRDCDADEWSAIVDRCLAEEGGSPYLVQTFCKRYRTPIIPLYGNEEDFTAEPRPFGNMTGLYIMNGEFAGVFNRMGASSIIINACGGVTSSVLWIRS